MFSPPTCQQNEVNIAITHSVKHSWTEISFGVSSNLRLNLFPEFFTCPRTNTLVPEAFFYTIFFIWKFATRSADRSAEPERKEYPLVKIVENVTFMLAQHLTAVKDVIFFWPITKENRIYEQIPTRIKQNQISSARLENSISLPFCI